MPGKIILQKLIELIFESTTSHLADIAGNKTTVSRVISTFLPPVAGSYVAWCFPPRILELNYLVFKRCMQLTNGSVLISCLVTGVTCAAVCVPGTDKGNLLFICQGLIMLTKNTK
jgi:hypothetical protein